MKCPSLRTIFGRYGRQQVKSTSSENIEHVAKLVKENLKFFLRILSDEVDTTKDGVRKILNKHLYTVKRALVKWPKSLRPAKRMNELEPVGKFWKLGAMVGLSWRVE